MKILPVVVIYKKELAESDSIVSILKADNDNTISEFVVYNNSPAEITIPDYFMGVKVHVINDYKNSGVSKAYNKALEIANELNYSHLLLLDQDTLFPENAIKIYLESVKKYKEINLFAPILETKQGAICSPLRYKFHRGFVVDSITPGEYKLDCYSPINSGMLLNVNAARKCGGYNEDVYLDFSDFQFIERFKKDNTFFIVLPLSLLQDFSGDEVNEKKLLDRFAIYCACAKKCERNSFWDDVIYFLMVLARTSKLAIKTGNLVFFKCFINKYIRG